MWIDMTTGVLFVCLGNICRSPAGEALFRKLADEAGVAGIEVASCGMGDWHEGKLADPRMRKAASARGLELESRAQAFDEKFFNDYPYILAADHSILRDLKRLARTPADHDHLFLLGDFGTVHRGVDVPDPYHGTEADFERSLDILEDHCEGFLAHLIDQLKPSE
jgi:low molecular weight protein-tyrosine phosphatase